MGRKTPSACGSAEGGGREREMSWDMRYFSRTSSRAIVVTCRYKSFKSAGRHFGRVEESLPRGSSVVVVGVSIAAFFVHFLVTV